jgi:hypothetical protein
MSLTLGYACPEPMRSRRLRPALAGALAGSALALAGCGQDGSSSRSLSLGQVPLVGGASVIASVKECDKGANAFCAIEAVVVDRSSTSSGALVIGERDRLRTLGWTGAAGDDGNERAADSPGHKLRLTYSTAAGDLTAIDLGWIMRPRAIALTLAHTLFARTPAMSIMLETGPA